MSNQILKPRRSGTSRLIRANVTNATTFDRALTDTEMAELYNNGCPITDDESKSKEYHHCTKFSFKTRLQLGQTDLVCDQCDVLECVGDTYSGDGIEVPPFYGYECTVCHHRFLGPYDQDFLSCTGFCKFGRQITVHLTTCPTCRDYTERMTLGAFRPFREEKK